MVRPTQFRPFRIGNRWKSTAQPATRSPLTTSSPSPFSRPTKITRRKYLPQTTKSVESQGTVTKRPKIETRFRFVPRRPLTRTTTPKAKDETTEVINDQALESSNQQSLEEDFEGGKTTEFADIAIALQNIQQAPLPITPNGINKVILPQTTTHRVLINKASVSQTTPRISSGKPTRTRVKYSTTSSPLFLTTTKPIKKDHRPRPFEKSGSSESNIFRPLSDYDYYDEADGSILGRIPEHSKVLLHSDGVIECLDQGSFPHPVSCKKFISCAKMENGRVQGWEYTCPKNLSFDPIGGMCNWSAGLGCNE